MPWKVCGVMDEKMRFIARLIDLECAGHFWFKSFIGLVVKAWHKVLIYSLASKIGFLKY